MSNRRISSLSSTEAHSAPSAPSISSHVSSTLYNSSSASAFNKNQPLSTPSSVKSSYRAVLSPNPLRLHEKPLSLSRFRKYAAGGGGFLLDNGNRKSSLDRPDRGLDYGSFHRPSPASGSSTTAPRMDQCLQLRQEDGDYEIRESSTRGTQHEPDDAIAMLNLVLLEVQKRKRGSCSTSKHRNSLLVPGSSEGPVTAGSVHRRGGSGSIARANSPTGSFLIPSRAASSSATVSGNRYIASLNEVASNSPPPPPGRPTFPSPSLSMLPFGGEEQQKHQRSLAREQLQELQKEYKFSESTLQRTLKAKKSLELSALFKKLLEIEGTRAKNLASLDIQSVTNKEERLFEYNPLRVIRNRKLRNRQKIQIDVSPWEDPGAVEQWVEDVAVSIYSPVGDDPCGFPPPPPGEGRKLKRAKMDWVIDPEEMFADYFWNRSEESKKKASQKRGKKKKQQGISSIGVSMDNSDLNSKPSDGDVKLSMESRRTDDVTKSYRQFGRGEDGFESTVTSSNEEVNSDSDYLFEDPDTDEPLGKSKTSSRRRKLGRIIHRHGKKKKLKQQELDAEDMRCKQKVEASDWIAYELEGRYTAPEQLIDQPEHRKSIDACDEYESDGRFSLVGRPLSGSLLRPGSKSSFERYAVAGDTILENITDKTEHIVPSIAISLSPPGVPPSCEDQHDRDDKRINKVGSKKPLNSIRKDLPVEARDKDFCDESGRESLEIDQISKKFSNKLKPKSSRRLGKVKSRVDKLRSEVSKVEDFIPWRREGGTGSAGLSSTTSSFTGSDDDIEKTRAISREGTLSASEIEDHWHEKGSRQSLDVPDLLRQWSFKNRNHGSSSRLADFTYERILRRSFDSDRETSPERSGRPNSKLRGPITITERDLSPGKVESLGVKPDHHHLARLALGKLRKLQPQTQPHGIDQDPPKQQQRQKLEMKRNPNIHSLCFSRRDICHTRATLISSGTVARAFGYPPIPDLQVFKSSCHKLDLILDVYQFKQQTFSAEELPRFQVRIGCVSNSFSHHYMPIVRSVADDADTLSALVTTDLTLSAKKLQDEVFALVRRRQKGKMRWVWRGVFAAIEWTVVVLMWVVWSVFLIFRIARGLVMATVRTVRWILWL